jgi:hypothetical protein
LELLRTELDRARPGKRDAIRAAGSPGALCDALGVARPQPSAEARLWAAGVIERPERQPLMEVATRGVHLLGATTSPTGEGMVGQAAT